MGKQTFEIGEIVRINRDLFNALRVIHNGDENYSPDWIQSPSLLLAEYGVVRVIIHTVGSLLTGPVTLDLYDAHGSIIDTEVGVPPTILHKPDDSFIERVKNHWVHDGEISEPVDIPSERDETGGFEVNEMVRINHAEMYKLLELHRYGFDTPPEWTHDSIVSALGWTSYAVVQHSHPSSMEEVNLYNSNGDIIKTGVKVPSKVLNKFVNDPTVKMGMCDTPAQLEVTDHTQDGAHGVPSTTPPVSLSEIHERHALRQETLLEDRGAVEELVTLLGGSVTWY